LNTVSLVHLTGFEPTLSANLILFLASRHTICRRLPAPRPQPCGRACRPARGRHTTFRSTDSNGWVDRGRPFVDSITVPSRAGPSHPRLSPA
jgi:hypothetical protein